MMVGLRPLPQHTDKGRHFWPTKRKLWLGGSAVVALLFLVTGFFFLTLVASIVGFVAILPSPSGEEFIYAWVPRIWRDRKLNRKDGMIHTVTLPEILNEEAVGEDDKGINLNRIQLNALPLEDGSLLGEVWATDRNIHTQYVIGSGDPHAATASSADATIAGQSFLNIMAEVGNTLGAGVRIVNFMDRRLHNPYHAIAFLAANALQEDTPAQKRRVENYLASLDLTHRGATVPMCGVAVSSKRPRSWAKANGPLPDSALEASTAYLASSIIYDRLVNSGVQNVRQPSMYELTGMMRLHFDPTAAEDFYGDLWYDLVNQNTGSLQQPHQSMVLTKGAFPNEWRAGNDYLVTGSTYHACGYVPYFSAYDAPDGAYRHLYGMLQGGWPHVIAMVMETLSHDVELKRAGKMRKNQQVDALAKAERGVSGDPQDAASQDSIASLENQLFYSGLPPVKSKIYAGVSAGSLADLKKAWLSLAAQFRTVGLPLTRLTGSSRQAEAQLLMIGISADRL